jgi:pimeloyl-ACP methyl ester carboxylesterase
MTKPLKIAKKNHALALVAPALRATQVISPAVTAALAERLFFQVPQAKVSPRGQEFLSRGDRFELGVHGRRIVGWTWGEGPTTYLVHGWGGSSGRIYPMAEALIEDGRRLVMFDAPGHGSSGRGLSSMPEFARSLQAVAAHTGEPEAVVAHSLGAAATALAASWSLAARRYVFIAPAANPAEWALAFGEMLRLSPDVMKRLRSRSERRLQFNWDDLDARVHARRMAAPLLIIHDRDDATVPFTNGTDLARSWPGARLVETAGLGHSDILRDPTVITSVLEFLNDGRTHDAPGRGVPADTTHAG